MRVSFIVIIFLAVFPGNYFVFPLIEAQEWPILVESLAFGLYFGMIFYTVQKAQGHFKLQDKKIGITTGLFIVVGLFLFPRLTELIIHGDLPFFK